jgi:hypothetical protein
MKRRWALDHLAFRVATFRSRIPRSESVFVRWRLVSSASISVKSSVSAACHRSPFVIARQLPA